MAYQTRAKRNAGRTEKKTEETTSSPRVISRKQEKEQLIHLNDRFAAYIDKVRSLELENSRLNLEITSIEEVIVNERSNREEVYEKELEDVRRDKAGLQIENEMYRAELDDLKPRVKKLEKELNSANNRISVLEASVAEKDGRIRVLSNENRNLEDQLNELRKELEKKENQLLVAKKQVKEEKVVRVDWENRFQSLKEGLAQKEQLHKELKEHYLKRIDFSDLDMVDDTSFNRLDILQELRDQHNEQASVFHTETEERYSITINELQTIAEKYKNQYTRCQDELRDLKSKQDDKNTEIVALKAQNDALAARIKDLEEQIRVEQRLHSEALENHSKAMAKQQKLYKELMNIKQSLDAEITTYRKLLEGEETRLQLDITQSPQKKTPKKQKQKAPECRQKRGSKGRRDEDARATVYSATGLVTIEDSDSEGEYIELHNTSESNDALVARIKDLEEQIRVEKGLHSEALENHSKAMAKQQKLYKELMNIKQSLDAEITTYRMLLEGEETRLQLDITQSPQKKTPKKQKQKAPERSQKRGIKRRRVEDARATVYSATATGVVAIKDSDPEGEYIKLHNTSESDRPLGGWVIKRSVDNGPEKTYKFTGKFVLKGGAEVTVWSSGSGTSEDLPTDLVSKNYDWGIGQQIDTTLVDASGEVMATRNLNREVVAYEDTDYGGVDDEVMATRNLNRREVVAYEDTDYGGADDEVMATRNLNRREVVAYEDTDYGGVDDEGDPEKRCSIM